MAVDALDEHRLGTGDEGGERAELVLDQPVLQGADPGGVDQRLGGVLGHLAVPVRQPLERLLAAAPTTLR